jgi:Fic family protein
MLLDATQNYSAPLTKERLFSWHSSLFSGDFKDARLLKIAVGEWRKGPVEVISGYYGKETIHFEGPSGEKVEKEMATFLEWFNEHSFIDPVLKAGIAHFYFVTIHPFEDGNGRIARAIADQMLARSEKSSQRYYSLSSQIQLERKHYYAVLEQSQKADLDITLWLKWFLGCLERAMSRAEQTLSKVIDKDQFWKKTGDVKFNDRQKKIVNLLLDGFEGNLSTSKWAKIAKCSQDTAYRDILQLMRLGVLVPSSEKGRSTHYLLKKEKLGLSL